MIEFDVETTGVQADYHDTFSYQFYDGKDSELIWVGDDQWRERVQRWLDRGAIEGVRAWNTKFDWAFADKDGFDLPPEGKWFDGMIGAHVLDERRSVALKAVGESLGFTEGADLQKQVKSWLADERKRRKKQSQEDGDELIEPNYSDVPRDLMADYAMEDVFLTRKVCDHQDQLLAQTPDLAAVVEFEHEVLRALYAVERRGMPVDEEGYRRLEVEAAENLEKLDDTVQALALAGIEKEDIEQFEFNPKSSKQILEALKRRGADLSFVTNDSMDAENLETVDDVLAAAVLDFRTEYKTLSTYVRPYIQRSYANSLRSWKMPFICPDGRIHANYRQLGARTGRMSCSDPSIQNQPRDDLRLRYNFRAEPGMKLVTCDLNSIEMAIFAAYAGDGRLLEAIKEGRDMHTMTADFVGLRERQRPGGVVESKRQRGKVFNFSIVYGAGVRSVRKAFRVNQADARKMINRYHDAYPEVSRLQAHIQWRLEDTGYLKSAWGRRFRVAPRDAYKGTNYLVQGSAADLLKASLIRLHKEGVPVVGCVHDELLAHVPQEDAEEVKRMMIAALVEHPRFTEKVPLAAEGDIVDRWSQAKDPNFKPKWED
jgi:DNA polymerase-1